MRAPAFLLLLLFFILVSFLFKFPLVALTPESPQPGALSSQLLAPPGLPLLLADGCVCNGTVEEHGNCSFMDWAGWAGVLPIFAFPQ